MLNLIYRSVRYAIVLPFGIIVLFGISIMCLLESISSSKELNKVFSKFKEEFLPLYNHGVKRMLLP